MWDQVFTEDKRLIGGRSQFINNVGKEIDNQITSIANKSLNHAIDLLRDKVSLMDKLVDELLEKETLDAEYVIDSLNSFISV